MTRITLILLVLFFVYYISEPLPFGLENYDSFELITAMVTGGIAHPPGYGFYLELNRWFHSLLGLWSIQAALSMTYFQCLSCFFAMLIFLRMIRLWGGSGLLFIFLMMSCSSFTQNIYSVEVYGFLILLLSLCLKLYFFRLSFISVRSQNILLGVVIGLMICHHLSLVPLAGLMIYRRSKESRFSSELILSLISAVLLSVALSLKSSQSIMNPWFDGASYTDFWQHLTAKVYQVAFLDIGFNVHSWQNFISVWPLEIWFIITLVLLFHFRGMQSQLHLAILALLIWPLFVYNISDISKPLITFYTLIAIIVSCVKIQVWLYLILLALSCIYSFREIQSFKSLGLNYKVRSMNQSIKDAYVAVSKKPDYKHIFIGYDSTFGIAYSRHVIGGEESLRMSVFPMWWLSFKPHLGSLLNDQFFSENSEAKGVHWSGLNRSQLRRFHSALIHFTKDLRANIIYPRSVQSEQLRLVLDILNDQNSVLYVPSGKPDLLKYLKKAGYVFVNRGFWNEIILDKDIYKVPDATVQRVYLQKYDASNYFVHVIFLEEVEQELVFRLSLKGELIESVGKVDPDGKIIFPLPINRIDGRATKLQILSDGILLSEVALVID